MSFFNLPPGYKFKLKSMPRGRHYPPGSITNSCNVPFKSLVVDFNGQCLVCQCDGWLPIPVGHALEFDSLEQVFSSKIAKILQQDVAEKKFTWCAIEHCGIQWANQYKKDFNLQINVDESCNLTCPSCRRHNIMITDGPEFEIKKKILTNIMTWLDKFEHPILITMSGNGDPLASAIIRPLFIDFVCKPTQKFILHTNGLLIDKVLHKSKIVPNLAQIIISVDAGSSETYHEIRRGGNWSTLIRNLDYLYQQNLMHLVSLQFCLQQKNWHDLENFAKLCEHYRCHGKVHKLDDWGTWNNTSTDHPDDWTLANGYFRDQDVSEASHPSWRQCRELVMNLLTRESIKITDPVIDRFGLRTNND